MNKKAYSKSLAFVIPVFAVLAIYTLIMVIMLYFTALTSVKEYWDFKLNPIGFPETWMFENYSNAFNAFSMKIGGEMVDLWDMFRNTIIYAIGCSVLKTLVPCVVAYLVAKYSVWFNKIVFSTVIIAMTLPIVGALPSQIQILKNLGVYNTLFAPLMLEASYLGMYFLVFHGMFKGLSDEYIEAAQLDGAGQMQILLQIVFPLVKTTVSAVWLLNFIAYWNDYQSPMVFMFDYPTVAVGLFRYVHFPSQQASATTEMQMAGCMLLILPIFLLFILFKDKLMGNLTVGGIKG